MKILSKLIHSDLFASRDYLLNHIVNRIPLVRLRMWAYERLGVSLDERKNTNISLGVEMWAGRGLSMGPRSTVGQRCYIDARGGIRLESDVSISREVAILTETHVADDPKFKSIRGSVHIDRWCWIGLRATVLPGVRIGEGAVVGAGSLVTANVEPYAVVGGVPAVVLRKRQGPMRYQLNWRPDWF